MVLVRGNSVFLGGRRIGVIYPSKRTFRAWRRSSKHLFRAYNGWGLNVELLNYLSLNDIKWVEIVDNDSGMLYRATVETIQAKGIAHDYDGEPQKILPLNEWDIFPLAHSLLEYT